MIKKLLVVLTLSRVLPQPAWAQSVGFDYNEAASAILSASSRAGNIRALGAVPSLGVIWVAHGSAPRLGFIDENISTLLISAQRNHSGIIKLRAALAANPATRQALTAHGVEISHVVGVQIGSNGSLRVFLM